MGLRVLGIFSLLIVLSSCSIEKFATHKPDKVYAEAGVEKHIYTLSESEVNVRICGSGKDTILLVHGFGPLPYMQWSKQVDDLADGYVMIVPDLVYFGESHSTSKKFSPEFQASQLGELLDSLNVEQVNVIGLSYGGLISAYFAKIFPERTENVVLIDALSRYYTSELADSIACSFQRESILDLLIPVDQLAIKQIFSITYAKTPYMPKFIRKKVKEELYSNQREEKTNLIRYLLEHETEIHAYDFKLDKSVSIIWGEQDGFLPVSNGEALVNYYSGSLYTISNTGHVANIESADRVNELIREIIPNQ